jgi:hypothetical protein
LEEDKEVTIRDLRTELRGSRERGGGFDIGEEVEEWTNDGCERCSFPVGCDEIIEA